MRGLTLFFWPDDSQKAVYAQMVDYVNRLIPEMIAQEHIRMLQEHVEGLKLVVRDYEDTTDPLQKGEYLTSLLSELDELEPEFFDERAPENALAPFIAFGTLKLAALREQYLYSNVYYTGDRDRALHYKKLQDTVAHYTAATATIKQRAIDWRISKIHEESQQYRSSFGKAPGPLVRYSRVRDDYCDYTSSQYYSYAGAHQGFLKILHNRVNEARTAYGANLDSLLRPTLDWPKLVPPPPERG